MSQLVDTSSPRFGEQATYYSAVCLETGEVEALTEKVETTLHEVAQLPDRILALMGRYCESLGVAA